MKYFSRPASFLDSERIRSGPTDSPPPPSATTDSLDRFFEEEVDALGGESQPTGVGLGQALHLSRFGGDRVALAVDPHQFGHVGGRAFADGVSLRRAHDVAAPRAEG